MYCLSLPISFRLLYRRQPLPIQKSQTTGSDIRRDWIILGGIVMPIGVLVLLFGYTMHILCRRKYPGNPAVKIRVIGRRWRWEVIYPDENITTANKIHIPVGLSQA